MHRVNSALRSRSLSSCPCPLPLLGRVPCLSCPCPSPFESFWMCDLGDVLMCIVDTLRKDQSGQHSAL